MAGLRARRLRSAGWGAPASGLELPSCGRYEALNEPLTPAQLDANSCLLAAFAADRPAELIVTSATVEGDPITTYYRVRGRSSVEVFADYTRDREGNLGWVHLRCEDIRQAGATEAPGQLVPIGCVEIPLDEAVR